MRALFYSYFSKTQPTIRYASACSKHNDIIALTGLRGVAAILVVLCHLSIPLTLINSWPFLTNIKELGWLGVPIYFVLSGYLITWLALNEIHSNSNLSLKRFYLRRILRVYPLYIVFSVLCLASWFVPVFKNHASATSPHWIVPILTATVNFSITFFNHWQDIGFIGIFWTLSLDEQFYLLWGCALKWIAQKQLLLLALLLTLTCFIWRLHPVPFNSFLEYRIDPPCSFATIMFGCILALLTTHEPRVSSRTNLIITLITLFAIVLLTIFEWPFTTNLWRCFNTITAADLICCALVFLCCQETGFFTRAFTWQPLAYLGNISFCMYVVNIPVVCFCNYIELKIRLFKQLTITHPWSAFITETIVIYLLVILISASWSLIDRPITNLRYRLRFDAARVN